MRQFIYFDMGGHSALPLGLLHFRYCDVTFMIKLYTHHCARKGLPRFDERFRHVPQQFSNTLYRVYHCNPRVKLMPSIVLNQLLLQK